MKQGYLKYFRGDKPVWAVAFLLGIISILAVYSSIVTLAYKYHSGDTFYYLIKHTFMLIIGFGFIYITHLVKYSFFSKIARVAYFTSVVLLLITLFQGTSINEARRWLTIPVINQTFQTSDLAKLSLITYLARFLSKSQEKMNDYKDVLFYLLIPTGLVCFLILRSNLSTSIMIFMVSLFMFFIGNVKIKYIFSIIGSGFFVIVMVFLIAKAKPDLFPRFYTWIQRVDSFKSQKSHTNFQANQSKIAIASGGLIGKGPGKSSQRNFLPHPYSDFIFSIIVEEYGLLGGVFVIILYLVLFYRGIKIASNAGSVFGMLLALGLTFSLVFQAFLNISVAINLIPVTGQTLPLVSMGGTSIWFTCLAIGILLSISCSQDKRELEIKATGNTIRP